MKQVVQYTAKLNFVGFNDDVLAEQVTNQLKARFTHLPAEESQFVVDRVIAEQLQQVETKPSGDLSQRAAQLENLARKQILSLTQFDYLIINEEQKTVIEAHQDNISSDASTSANRLTVVIYKNQEPEQFGAEVDSEDYAALVTSLKLIPSGVELANQLADFIGNHFVMEQIGLIYTKAYSDSKYCHMLPAPKAAVSGLELARAEDNVRRLWSVLSEPQKEFASGIGLAPEGDKSYPVWGRDCSGTRHKELISEAIMQAEGKVKAINEPVIEVTQRTIR